MRETLRSLRYPLAYALVAALISFYPLCLETYRLVIDDRAPLNIEGEFGQRFPIPRALVWSPATKNLVSSLTLLAPGAVIGLGIGLVAILLYGMLRLLNPTFRLTTGVDWDQTVLTETYIHTAPLIKAFLILMAAIVPLFILWAGIPYLLGGSFASIAVRLVLTGAAFWVLFSRHGVAGDYDSLNYDFPRDRPMLRTILGRGALAGLASAAVVWLWRYTDAAPLFDFYASLGSLGESHWKCIVAITAGAAALLGFAGGLFLIALAPPRASSAYRIRWSLLGLALLVVFLAARGYALPRFLESRYDYDADRFEADAAGIMRGAKTLAARAGIPLQTGGADSVLVFRRQGLIAWGVRRSSVVGLDISPDSARKLREFLARRNYATSLSDSAYKTLHDSASARWDHVGSLQVDMLNLLHAPDIQYVRLLVGKLRGSPSTPEVLAIADQLADEKQFAYVSRDARMVMGDIYASLGRREQAAIWFRKADVPEARIPELLSARTMFAEGRITGRLLLNDKPLSGATVGLAPSVTVREAFNSMVSPGVVRPFWLRWIGAVASTREDGRFELSNITAGEYRMLLSHPDLQVPPLDRRISADRLLGRIFVGFGRPRTDLGDIRIRFDRSRAPDPAPPPRSPIPIPPASPAPPPPSGR